MRILSIGVVFLSLVSCLSAQECPITVLSGGIPALELTVPQAAKVTPWKGKTVIQTTNMFLYIWSVPGVKTVDAAQTRLAEVIKDDVRQFAASVTNEIAVAGSPARHLIGKGVEADDGDDATADIVIFSIGDRIFVACVHGEGNDASRERAPMLTMLKTAKSPRKSNAGK